MLTVTFVPILKNEKVITGLILQIHWKVSRELTTNFKKEKNKCPDSISEVLYSVYSNRAICFISFVETKIYARKTSVKLLSELVMFANI